MFKKKHKHKFNPVSSIVVKDHPRLVQICKCGRAVHTPIYTLTQLRIIDKEDEEEI